MCEFHSILLSQLSMVLHLLVSDNISIYQQELILKKLLGRGWQQCKVSLRASTCIHSPCQPYTTHINTQNTKHTSHTSSHKPQNTHHTQAHTNHKTHIIHKLTQTTKHTSYTSSHIWQIIHHTHHTTHSIHLPHTHTHMLTHQTPHTHARTPHTYYTHTHACERRERERATERSKTDKRRKPVTEKIERQREQLGEAEVKSLFSPLSFPLSFFLDPL